MLENAYEVSDIDNNVILKYCELYTMLKEKGQIIPDADLLIATTAVSNKLVLVTKDKDFERLKEYDIEIEIRK